MKTRTEIANLAFSRVRICLQFGLNPLVKRGTYEHHDDVQSLSVDSGAHPDSGACRTGGGTEPGFKGSFQGQEIDTPQGGPPPTTLNAAGSTTGIATLVGQMSFTYQLTVTLANSTATGSGHLIAANGDSVYTTITGSSDDTIPGFASITEIDTIIGGTGRFARAQGSFTVERLVNLATGFTSGSFHGTITSPGAAH